MLTALKPCSLRIIISSLGKMENLGNGKSNSLIAICHLYVEPLSIDPFYLAPWSCNWHGSSPTPLVLNIIHQPNKPL
jgi:hypothetical protein